MPLNAPSNGMINCTLGDNGAANPGDTCSFTCTGGFVLDGSTNRMCQDDGSWDGSDAMCRGMICLTMQNYMIIASQHNCIVQCCMYAFAS